MQSKTVKSDVCTMQQEFVIGITTAALVSFYISGGQTAKNSRPALGPQLIQFLRLKQCMFVPVETGYVVTNSGILAPALEHVLGISSSLQDGCPEEDKEICTG